MPNRDFSSEVKPVNAILPQILTASSTSEAIDVRSFDKALIIAQVGTATITPTTTNKFSLVVKESSSSAGTFTAVAAANLVGALSGTTIGAFAIIDAAGKASNVYKASYVGSKRWIRVAATESGTAALRVSATVIGGDLNVAPAV